MQTWKAPSVKSQGMIRCGSWEEGTSEWIPTKAILVGSYSFQNKFSVVREASRDSSCVHPLCTHHPEGVPLLLVQEINVTPLPTAPGKDRDKWKSEDTDPASSTLG